MEVNVIKHLDKRMKLDFWKPKSSHDIIPKSSVYFRANAEHSEAIVSLLNKKGIKYKVVINNLQEAVENQFRKQGKYKRGLPRYHEWKEIAVWAYSISLNHPNLASLVTIGHTFEGNPMHVLKIGNPKSAKNSVFLECGIHAREWISPAFCQWFVNEAVETYGQNEVMTKLLDNLIFHVLPVFNIDGYIFTWTSNRFWRKNRAPTPEENCFGIDLNRKFNSSWKNTGSYGNPCFQIYSGTGPESAPETKAVSTYIREHLSIMKAYLSFHSFSQLLMYPYAYTKELAPDHEELDKIAKAAVESLERLYNTSYKYGSIATTLYAAYGSSIDWTYDQGIKYSYVFELRDDGEYGFLLPEYDIEPTCRETMLAVKQIASYLIDLDT
ncbi:PREDICTED: mast cell carboxypeptidase A-like [Nanorana parkeri]|uniref:mast cell carboxypeptidase A-like n=1 Tax=Nanorana parkeri TaxID=125878 RepID=UPI000854073F|nr:PREDICTED: mast cell carboxypeptidase A-like [Nanorana parkeri]